jgi:hypothetical protein
MAKTRVCNVLISGLTGKDNTGAPYLSHFCFVGALA